MADPNNSKSIASDEVNLREALIQLMRDRYPDIAAYQEGQLLTEIYAEPETRIPPTVLPETPKTDSGYQIDPNNIVQGESIKIRNLYSKEPYNIDNANLLERLDQEFSFFVGELDEIGEPEGEIEDNVFIVNFDLNIDDPHHLYLTQGPRGDNDQNQGANNFCVFFIDNGKARRIPDYKTLEVMLVARQLTYGDIRRADSTDTQRYVLNAANNDNQIMEGMSNKWGLQVRFDSGYKPKAPFKRDPADYYEEGTSNEFGQPYMELAYKGQTSLEKLRAKYEGSFATYDIYFDNNESFGNDASPNSNFGQPTGTSTADIRFMTFGYWKFVDNIEVFKLYNELMDLGINMPAGGPESYNGESRKLAIIELYKNGHCANFEAASKTPVKKAGGSEESGGELMENEGYLAGWNDFPHITGANLLDLTEFSEYMDNTNNGNPFDLEYMEPYEPEGSIKYYSAATTADLMLEAVESLDSLSSQLQQQYQLDNLYNETKANIESLHSDIGNDITNLSAGAISAERDRMNAEMYEFLRDLVVMFDTNADGNSVSDSDQFRLQLNGATIVTDPNVFQCSRFLNENMLAELDQKYILLLNNNAPWLGPESPYGLFGRAVYYNIMNGPTYIADRTEWNGLFEFLMDDTRLASALTVMVPSTPIDNIYDALTNTWNYGTISAGGPVNFSGDNGVNFAPDFFNSSFNSFRSTGGLTNVDLAFTALFEIASAEAANWDISPLENLREEVAATLWHSQQSGQHRYRSQIEDLVDGRHGQESYYNVTNQRIIFKGYQQLKAEYDQLINPNTVYEVSSQLMQHVKRAYTLAAYQFIAYYRYNMSAYGFDIVWSNKSIELITKYIPEWASSDMRDKFFTGNYTDSQSVLQDFNSLYVAEQGSLQNIFNTNRSAGNWNVQYHHLTGPTSPGNSGGPYTLDEWTHGYSAAFNYDDPNDTNGPQNPEDNYGGS